MFLVNDIPTYVATYKPQKHCSHTVQGRNIILRTNYNDHITIIIISIMAKVTMKVMTLFMSLLH